MEDMAVQCGLESRATVLILLRAIVWNKKGFVSIVRGRTTSTV